MTTKPSKPPFFTAKLPRRRTTALIRPVEIDEAKTLVIPPITLESLTDDEHADALVDSLSIYAADDV